MVGNIVSILGTFASLASVAALAQQMARLRSDFTAYQEENNKKVVKFKNIAEQALNLAQENEKNIREAEGVIAENKKRIDQVEADTLTNKLAIERYNKQVTDMNTVVDKIKTDASKAVSDANAAINKANAAIDTANAATEKASQSNKQLKQEVVNTAKQEVQKSTQTIHADVGKLKAEVQEIKPETYQERLQRLRRELIEERTKTQKELQEDYKKRIQENYKTQEELRQERQKKIDEHLDQVRRRWDDQFQKSDTKIDQNKQDITNLKNLPQRNNVNKQDVDNLNKKIDETNENIKKIPSIETIALTVAGLDVFRQILTNTQNPALPCQAPALVPPVGVGVNAANVAIGGMQQVIWSKVHTVGTTVTANNKILTSPQFGLQKISEFASTAWKATHADKVMGVYVPQLLI